MPQLTWEEKQLVFRKIIYAPSALQAKVHQAEERVVLVAGGERGGKSRVGSADLTANALDGRLFWTVGPDYHQANAEFDYCHSDLARIDAVQDVSIPRQGPRVIVMRGGTTIETRSGEDAVKLGKASTATESRIAEQVGSVLAQAIKAAGQTAAEPEKRGKGASAP